MLDTGHRSCLCRCVLPHGRFPLRSQELLEIEWANTSSMQFPNGWGVVVDGSLVMYCAGAIPDSILAKFRKRKQYIFLLETFAQVLVLLLFWPELGPYYISYVDNSASQWSLTKGYSSDSERNTIVCLFWRMAGILGISQWFERGPSKANLAVFRTTCSQSLQSGNFHM